ncbi:unnamed protein product [Rotaria sp. Silwood1]|nr:unnamed protein product [Rotaria sp. Silwood1]
MGSLIFGVLSDRYSRRPIMGIWLRDSYRLFGSVLVQIVDYVIIDLALSRSGQKATFFFSFVMGYSIFAFLPVLIQRFMNEGNGGSSL